MDRLPAYAFSLGEMNSAGRFHSRIRQLTLNTVAIYNTIWAAPNPLFTLPALPLPHQIKFLCGKVAEVKRGKEEGFYPTVPLRSLPHSAPLSFLPAPTLAPYLWPREFPPLSPDAESLGLALLLLLTA